MFISAGLAIHGTHKTYYSTYDGDDEYLKFISKMKEERLNKKEEKKGWIGFALMLVGFALILLIAYYCINFT